MGVIHTYLFRARRIVVAVKKKHRGDDFGVTPRGDASCLPIFADLRLGVDVLITEVIYDLPLIHVLYARGRK